MNKAILLLSLLLPLNASADTPSIGSISGVFPCYNFEELRQSLKEDGHGELPVISSKGITQLLNQQTKKIGYAKHEVYVFANPKTYSYTLVFKMDDMGCIVSMGDELGPVIQDNGI